MKREKFLLALESIKKKENNLKEIRSQLLLEYIESNKCCNVGDRVSIVLSSGKVVEGVVKKFGILHDKNVYITEYKVGSFSKFITVPYKSVTVL